MCTMYENNLVNEITQLKLYILSLLTDKSDDLSSCIQDSVNNLCAGIATVSDINNNINENRIDIMITHSGTTNDKIKHAIASGYINFIDQNSPSIPEELFAIYRKLHINCNIAALFNVTFINTGAEEYCNEIKCIIIL